MQRALAVVLLALGVRPAPALLAIVFIHASDLHTQMPAYQIALVMYVVVLVVGKQAVSDNGVLTSVPCYSWANRHIYTQLYSQRHTYVCACALRLYTDCVAGMVRIGDC